MYSFLSQFCTIKCKLPNFLVASLKDDDIKQAQEKGIKPGHILRYLNTNTHPTVMEKRVKKMSKEERKNVIKDFSCIPINVVSHVKDLKCEIANETINDNSYEP